MNASQWLIKAMLAEGVDTLFGYPGGAIMPFYDALYGSDMRHILVRHEQAAAFAANGYARASGKVGVCVATSGPGASNLVTGMADALLDSVPMVCITGQVASPLIGTDAFQELDVYGLTLPIVKHSFLVRHLHELPEVVREAFRIARSDRPGPVLIDLPKDIQIADASELPAYVPAPVQQREAAPDAAVQAAAALLASAKQPVLYAGGGVVLAEAEAQLRSFVDATGLPSTLTLKGLGALPAAHPHLLGMIGMHGTHGANLAVHEADVLLVVGARFDDRATGKLSEFAPNAEVIHMDADAAELSKLRHADVALPGNLRLNLQHLQQALLAHGDNTALPAWRDVCQQRRDSHAARYDAPGSGVYAPALLKRLSELAPDAVVACDVGQHQMWVAQHWRLQRARNHLTSGGLGAMGFGLPAAIGAQLQNPQGQVVCVSGDGSFMMNVQELATLYRYNIPVKIVLLDNQVLGMVRQWQTLFFDERHSEIDLSDNPDFAELAKVFRITSRSLRDASDMDAALAELLAHDGPMLLHVHIDSKANVWPLVPPNSNNTQMLDMHINTDAPLPPPDADDDSHVPQPMATEEVCA